MARILVVESVAQPGTDVLSASHQTDVRLGLSRDELLQLLGGGGGYDALICRSATRVDGELRSPWRFSPTPPRRFRWRPPAWWPSPG